MPTEQDKIEVNHDNFTSSIPTTSDHKIHPYNMPFADGKGQHSEYTTQAQAQKMFADFKKVLQANEDAKIAITYSANDQEAQDIVAGYNDSTKNISLGSNQGEVMQKLIQLIKNNNLQDKIHILPVATMARKNGKVIAITETEIKRDMGNIAKHLGAGWIVLGWKNQGTQDPNKYAIGGDISQKVWVDNDNGDSPKQLCEEALNCMTESEWYEPGFGLPELFDEDGASEKKKDNENLIYLQECYEEGKSNPNSLLIQQKIKPEPQIPAVTANNNLIATCDWDKLNRVESFSKDFKFHKNTEESNTTLKGWISKKDQPEDRLVEIEANKLKLPLDDAGNPKADQAEAVVAAFKQLVEHAKSKPSYLPLNITANDAFTQEQLKETINLLLKENLPIKLSTQSQVAEIKSLIQQFNTANNHAIVRHYPPTLRLSSPASSVIPPPSLRIVDAKKLNQ